jgi:glycyl-tRNA synthetase
MEIEYFVDPATWEENFEQLRGQCHEFLEGVIGLPTDRLHELEVPENDRAHYSKRTIDIEFDYPIGREELMGLAYRTDFDLSNVQRESGRNMEYRPKSGGAPLVPHVIEPSFGVERLVMAVLVSAYTEEKVNDETRTVLKLPEQLAPYRYAVAPLLKNKQELVGLAQKVYTVLREKYGNVVYEDSGNIGKRYRKQDEIGTPKFVVVDFTTLEDDTVTVRDRDTMKQVRVKIKEL